VENEPEEDSASETNREVGGRLSAETDDISLEAAIEQTPARSLRTVIKWLVKEQSSANAFLTDRLLIPIPGESGDRKHKRYDTCQSCNRNYIVQFNAKGKCIYHPGKHFGLEALDGLAVNSLQGRN
jgi:hypothetical protein